MPKREINTSNMFKTMAGTGGSRRRSEDFEEEAFAPTKTPTEPHEQAQANSQPTQKKVDKLSKNKPKLKDRPVNDKQSIKLGFYLTPNTYTAMKIHKALNGIGSHKDSKIINDALTSYLSKELNALSEIDENLSEEERFSKALKSLL